MKLHHVGIAVDDLEAAVALYRSAFGAELVRRAMSEQDGLAAAFMHAGDAEIELLQALRVDTPVGRFVARRGPGLHHIAVAVPDIERAIAEAHEQGLEMIDERPRVGLHGTRIAFIQPKSVRGVLTELVEA
jgi:methylmalonyl-CoA/ethylmalonyl-CoA epimerase